MTRYVGIAEETTYGTAVAPTTYIEAKNETMRSKVDYQGQEHMASRDVEKLSQGRSWSEGSWVMYAEPENGIGKLLKWGLDSVPDSAIQGTSSAYKHTFTPDDVVTPFTVEVGRDSNAHIHPGGVLSQIEFACEKGDFLMVTPAVIGRVQDTPGALDSPTFSDLNAFNFDECTFEIGDVAYADIRAFTLMINNNPDDDNFGLTQRGYVKAPSFQRREVTGRVDLSDYDDTEYQKFLSGTTAKLEFLFTGEVITGAYNQEFNITLPKVQYYDIETNVDGVDVQRQSVPFKAYYDETVDYVVQIDLMNEVTTYA